MPDSAFRTTSSNDLRTENQSTVIDPTPITPAASEPDSSLQRRLTWGRAREQLIQSALFLCAFLSVVTTVGIILVLLSESVYSFDAENPAFFQVFSLREFLTGTEWVYKDDKFGVLPLLCGTVLVAGIAALIALPIGMASAVYLSEYASPRLRGTIKPILEILAGIPTVVYGYFALAFVNPYVLRPIFAGLLGFDVSAQCAASAGLVVGVMIIPMVSSLSEDALRAVPRSLREAGYALGSTRFDVSTRIVIPAALSGIIASFLLAISRAIGETMAVAIAAGLTPNLSADVFEPFQTMTGYIVQISGADVDAGSAKYKSLYAVALCLFFATLTMNVVSQTVMRKYREVYV